MKNLDNRVNQAYAKYEKLGHLELPDLFDWLLKPKFEDIIILKEEDDDER